MGMFDSVYVNCKECGSKLEFQSKSGPCDLNQYTINNAPPEVLIDLNMDIQECKSCHHQNQIHVQVMTCVTIS